MSEIYSSVQAAEMLGVSPNTLRTWKSRKADQLNEGQHWVSQDGQTFWTQAGLEMLQQLRGESPTVADPKREPIQNETLTDSDRYTELIESVADAISPGIMQRVDAAVMTRVKRALVSPLTATERVTILSQLGLKPANPELLLQQSTTNYLPQGE